jgi:hypothetical protein
MTEGLLLADAGSWLSRVVLGAFRLTLLQLLFLAAPFFLLAYLLHWLERTSQGHLSSRFGWRSVLWTGWIGTPVHELSHAAMCPVFGHKIKEVAPFKPDELTGCLGYVKHSFNPKNPYHQIGSFFIGIAPLAGGALVLYSLLWIFYAPAARNALSAAGVGDAVARGSVVAAAEMLFRLAVWTVTSIASLEGLKTWRFWIFMYLALCIGSHLGPSPADLKGGKTGALLLVGLLLVFNLLFLALGGTPGAVMAAVGRAMGPALALFALSVVLSGVATAVVVLVTGAI